MPLNVCVYGSSSKQTPASYLHAATVLGDELAKRGHTCVNGAGAHGVMGALNRASRAAKGRVIGVCHKMFVDGEITALFDGMELVLTGGSDLVERKAALMAKSDCYIALPGGPGTWDELWEVACACQLGIGRSGPICLVNTDGYYDGFVRQLERADADRLLHKPPAEFLHVAADPKSALDWCEAHMKDEAQLADTVYASQVQFSSIRSLTLRDVAGWVALGATCGLLATLTVVATLRRR